jgi:hypothetical protein
MPSWSVEGQLLPLHLKVEGGCVKLGVYTDQGLHLHSIMFLGDLNNLAEVCSSCHKSSICFSSAVLSQKQFTSI